MPHPKTKHKGLWARTPGVDEASVYAALPRELLMALAETCEYEIEAAAPNPFVDGLNQNQRKHRALIEQALDAQARRGFLDGATQEADLFCSA